jgi:hypothetical protein
LNGFRRITVSERMNDGIEEDTRASHEVSGARRPVWLGSSPNLGVDILDTTVRFR